MDVGFIPIKSKILPQYDNSIPQTENIVKAQTFAVSENSKKSNATNAVASTAGVKILSPSSGKEIPVGNLTIFGISTDNEKSDCTVSVDWNKKKQRLLDHMEKMIIPHGHTHILPHITL